MKDLKDVTPSVFGLVIAYLLPGLGALFSIALFYEPAASLLRAFSDAQSTVGLFFFVVVTSLLLGMQLAACRWFLFEEVVFKTIAFRPAEFAALRSPDVAASFRLFIDEAYRYHQFFGAQIFVLPPLLLGIAHRAELEVATWPTLLLAIVGVALEVITWSAAAEGWRRYVYRGRLILSGTEDVNGIRTDEEKSGKETIGKEKKTGGKKTS